MSNQKKLTIQLKSIEASGGATVRESSDLITNLAEAAGVAPGAIMKDIAASAKDFALYSTDSVKGLAMAAIEAKKLGLSLSDAAAISNNLLDIDTALEAELEASALLGRQINFNKARELALSGDIAGASAAVLSQVGDINAWHNLNVYQRQALAKAAGLEVSQLEKTLVAQAEQAKHVQMTSTFLGTVLAHSLGILETGKNWTVTLFENAHLIGATAGLLKPVGGLVAGIGKGFTGIFKGLGGIVSRIGKFASSASDVAKSTTKAGPAGVGMQKSLSSLGQGLKSMSGAKVLFGALNLIPAAIGL
ncbi:MAG: hypothetical protein IH995_10605, partial [Proteobacteria bacterium]|nr:hypothetical protein [Pseudomonadota bacterium]